MKKTSFFMAMIPPTTTYQEKAWHVVKGKPSPYEPPELRAARAKLKAHLAAHVPDQPYTGGVQLQVKWCFPRGSHKDGEYKVTKPDTDNLQKLLKDVMTSLGFWRDDAQVALEVVEKFWADIPGIAIFIADLEVLTNPSTSKGEIIRAKRLFAKITQQELATKLNVSPSYISQVETNHRNPKAETMTAILNAIDQILDERKTEVTA